MNKDPIVDEVRAIRDQHAKQFDYDLNAIFDHIKQQEQNSQKKTVSLPSKPVPPYQNRKTA